MIIPNRGSRVLIRKMNSMLVLSASQPKGRAEAAEAEHQPEKIPATIPTLPGIRSVA